MPDNNLESSSLIPTQNNSLIKAGNVLEVTDKILAESANRQLFKSYKSVIIGNQEWLVENLNVSHFRNGELIPEAKTTEDWIKTGKENKPAWCYYDNDQKNGERYGKLYNWYAVNDPRGLAPDGWHIPSDDEWTTLTDYLGGKDIAGGKLKETGTIHWQSPNKGADNSSGFTALPGGYRSSGAFNSIGSIGNWWSSTEISWALAWLRLMNIHSSKAYSFYQSREDGYSVRCIRD